LLLRKKRAGIDLLLRVSCSVAMRIVVLDGYTLNPGDLGWQAFKALGDCAVYDRTTPAETVPQATGAQIVLTNKVVLGRAEIARLPMVKYIGVLATGTNVVDLAAAREAGILVTNVPAYSTQSVAQTTMALLLELTQHVGQHSAGVHQGKWSASRDWCYWEKPLIELDGLTMGIIGVGRIGAAVARLARAFGMRVLAATRRPVAPSAEAWETVTLETLLRQSDVVSLHCPLTPETRVLINAKTLALMKPTALLLNTSRGLLIDEAALAEALNSGRLAGAGLDVLSEEPPPPNNPLLGARNCYITPHLGWGTRAARQRLMDVAVENLRAFLAGRPRNVVN
jgi:glycerate dehydrogenase